MKRAVGLLALSLLVIDSQASACEEGTSTAELRLVVEEAEAAYIALDVDGVSDRLGALDALTPCLDEALPRPDAARYHRIQGLGAFIRRDSEAASRAFLAARSIEPDAALPSSLVPAGHPVQILYASLSLEDQTYGFLPEPAGSYLLLDGRREDQLPQSRPFLFQRIEEAGAVAQTAYLWPGEPLPAFAVAPPSMPGPITSPDEPAEPTTAEPHPPAPTGRGVVLVGTGLSAVATGMFFALNRTRSSAYHGADITLGELDGTRQKVNRYGAATLTAAVLTSAGGVALAVVW